MPTLNWIGKEKIISHHNEVPYSLLDKKYSFGDKNLNNMVIHGDNLYALKALLPRYENAIDCIYIDPPYNTGEEKWIYNDNVNDPRILKWLGEVVGKEGEDLSRHDKWLCMMYPRLSLMKKLLSERGIIFISIDDNEYVNLKMIMDEIFGKNNFCATYFWKRTETPPALSYKVRKKSNIDKRKFAQGYTDGGDAPLLNNGNPEGELLFKKGTVHFNIPDGVYHNSSEMKIDLLENVVVENGINKNDFKAKGHFKWGQDYLENEMNNDGYIIVKSKQFSMRYQKRDKSLKIPSNIIDSEVNVDTNETAKKELIELGLDSEEFDYAKPVSLIKYLIKMPYFLEKDICVLDAFAGSGTTGHAVCELNNEDNGNRKFIEIEMMDYANTITAERLKKLKEKKHMDINFSYYELGESIFDENNNINKNIPNQEVKKFIYYTETHKDIENIADNSFYIGTNDETAYYIFYDKEKNICLNYELLSQIKIKSDYYVIYADSCTLSSNFLTSNHIIFKKIPRDIQKY